MKIRLATNEIQRDSIVDGEGIRSVIWTQGCIHNCKECHNPETHSFASGYLIDIEDVIKKIDKLEGQDGITFSGGDPMEQAEACYHIAKYCKSKRLNIWCYTGYTYEELLKRSKHFPFIRKFLEVIDVLVDGKFIVEQKSLNLKFRGSRNQRIIDVPMSLRENKVCLIPKYTKDKSYDKIAKKGQQSATYNMSFVLLGYVA